MLHNKKYNSIVVFKSLVLMFIILTITSCTDTSVEKNADTDLINSDTVVIPPDTLLPTPTPVLPIDVKVSVVLQETTVSAGDIVTARILQNSLLSTEGGGINLQYNPQSIEIQEVKVDASVWTFGHHNGVIDNSSGIVSDIVFANYTGAQGESDIATIIIKVLTNDKTEITMTESSLNPFASNGKKISASFGSLLIN